MKSHAVLFHFIKILIFRAIRNVKGQKIAQKAISHSSHAISQGQCSIWSWFLVDLCKMMISPVFLIFSKFCCLRLLKRQKMVQNGKTCLLCSIYYEPYIIWLWFLVHICKMMISPARFFILSSFCIFRVLGG